MTFQLFILSFAVGVISMIILRWLYVFSTIFIYRIKTFRRIIKQNKLFKEKEKARHEFLAKGNVHEWVTVLDPISQKEVTMCKKTFYCPEIDVYLPEKAIELDKLFKEKAEYRVQWGKKHMQELSDNYGMEVDKLHQLLEDFNNLQDKWAQDETAIKHEQQMMEFIDV